MNNRVTSVITVPLAIIVLTAATVVAAPPRTPNFLVILTDDLGYSDLGCYGSEIETPVLDNLAGNGIRFSQFYNTAKCHSSRVCLMSGRWCMQAGDIQLHRSVIIPEVISPAGYFTAMTGKWHLSKQPTDFGFQRYFGHLSGACNYYQGDKTFRLNGEPWTVPAKGFYTTVANVDYALRFLDDARREKKPWFLYIAFNAPHAPLQPLQEDYEKYLGKYDKGWDEVHAGRVQKQKNLKLLPQNTAPSPRPDHIPAWDRVTPEIRAWESRRMAAYAALITRIDIEIGRVVDDLRKRDELENTLIMFFSDNGACPYDRSSTGQDRNPCSPDVSWSDSTGWAWARNTPFRYYKQNQFEGGIATPAIMHWPAGIHREKGSVCRTPAHLVDVLPTIAELAGATPPATFPGREPSPLAGVSLAPLLAGGELDKRPPIHLMFNQDRGLREGDWKIASFQSGPWELYNIATDRTELKNLASEYPERVAAMSKQWHETAEKELRAPAHLRTPVAADRDGPHEHREWSDYSGANGAVTSCRNARPGREKNTRPATTIRARRDTKLRVTEEELILTCDNGDPGIAIDHLKPFQEAGPYRLVFEVKSNAGGRGEVYFTTDSQQRLPDGGHIEFDVIHDGQWHGMQVDLNTDKPVHALRLDLCTEAGIIHIRGLQLQTTAGKMLLSWPEHTEQ